FRLRPLHDARTIYLRKYLELTCVGHSLGVFVRGHLDPMADPCAAAKTDGLGWLQSNEAGPTTSNPAPRSPPHRCPAANRRPRLPRARVQGRGGPVAGRYA